MLRRETNVVKKYFIDALIVLAIVGIVVACVCEYLAARACRAKEGVWIHRSEGGLCFKNGSLINP